MNLGQQATLDEEMAPSAGLLTPAQRREVEIWFSQALDLSSDRRREYEKADSLFWQCLSRDGGNVLVVRAYLENLARWRGRTGKSSWRGWWARRGFLRTQLRAPARYLAAVSFLSRAPHVEVLEVLAGACRELGWELAEEAYLRESLLRDAGQVEIHARLAEICTSRADFACAKAHFDFAKPFLPQFNVAACLDAVRETVLATLEMYDTATQALDAARNLIAAMQFTAAERLLTQSQAVLGNSLGIREAREDLQLAQLRFQFEALEKLEQARNELAAKARVSLHQKLMRLQLDLAGTRADRYPEDWGLRLGLVERLIGVGNYFEALRRLKEPPLAPPGMLSARALRLTAETQQRLRRFEAAMELYRELLDAPGFGELPVEEQERVRSQAERLAGAMGIST